MFQVWLQSVHPKWMPIVVKALAAMSLEYLQELSVRDDWLPNQDRIFQAFSQPYDAVRYILFGESPYPRPESANGYAFWDASVHSLWSKTGFSKSVNRATSLRNFMKMLLIADGALLPEDTSQAAIAALDHSLYIATAQALFQNLLNAGFLLLNAVPVYVPSELRYHAKAWQPFMKILLSEILKQPAPPRLILFGKIAERIPMREKFDCLVAMHPYNLSFITHEPVLRFFKPMDLLHHHETETL